MQVRARSVTRDRAVRDTLSGTNNYPMNVTALHPLTPHPPPVFPPIRYSGNHYGPLNLGNPCALSAAEFDGRAPVVFCQINVASCYHCLCPRSF
ncbi:hypothetical protein J6590_011406 [Homalodisca vitripennis]|nr:hypothetical protein J6590_011406 [Homalodisca vitripennis]